MLLYYKPNKRNKEQVYNMGDNTPAEVKALIDDVVERTPNKYACYNYDTDEEAIRQVSVIQGLSCAGTFGLAFGPVGLLAGAGMGLAMGYLCSDNRAEAEKEKILRERVIKVFAEIQNGTIDFHDQREILPYFCQSPKLANLKPETLKNIIQNIRVDKHIYYQKNVRRKSNIVNAYDKYTSQYSATSVLASLINNVHLDELLPKYYDIIDNKIDTLQDTHEKREILKNKLYILKKGNKAFDKKGLDLKTDFFELRKEVSKNKKDISEVKKDISK